MNAQVKQAKKKRKEKEIVFSFFRLTNKCHVYLYFVYFYPFIFTIFRHFFLNSLPVTIIPPKTQFSSLFPHFAFHLVPFSFVFCLALLCCRLLIHFRLAKKQKEKKKSNCTVVNRFDKAFDVQMHQLMILLPLFHDGPIHFRQGQLIVGLSDSIAVIPPGTGRGRRR